MTNNERKFLAEALGALKAARRAVSMAQDSVGDVHLSSPSPATDEIDDLCIAADAKIERAVALLEAATQ